MVSAEPLAIIGLGCRFPRAADPDVLWRLLRDGIAAVGAQPASRADPPSRSLSGPGGFLDQVEAWDAAFFRIPPAEAARIDPQQRLVLEVAWEGRSRRRDRPRRSRRQRHRLFIGVSSYDYGAFQVSAPRHPGGHFYLREAAPDLVGEICRALYGTLVGAPGGRLTNHCTPATLRTPIRKPNDVGGPCTGLARSNVSTSADVNVTFKDVLGVDIGLPTPVSVALADLHVGLTAVPKILVGADPVSIGITQLPKLSVGVDPLTINPVSVGITQLPKISVGVDPLTINPLTVTLAPLDLTVKLTEFPSIRVHIPAHFRVGLSFLGRELFSAGLRGEAQVITEPYTAGPCERCGTGP